MLSSIAQRLFYQPILGDGRSASGLKKGRSEDQITKLNFIIIYCTFSLLFSLSSCFQSHKFLCKFLSFFLLSLWHRTLVWGYKSCFSFKTPGYAVFTPNRCCHEGQQCCVVFAPWWGAGGQPQRDMNDVTLSKSNEVKWNHETLNAFIFLLYLCTTDFGFCCLRP